jgi:hypothetical protein
MAQTRANLIRPISTRVSRPGAASVALVLAPMLAGLAGCAGPVPRREASAAAYAGNQGSASETVFSTPEVADALALSNEPVGPEYARRDSLLSADPRGPLLATAEWPEPARASLERPRYIRVRDDRDRFTFFLHERSHRDRVWWGSPYPHR